MLSASVHHPPDPIENLRIKVKLSKVASKNVPLDDGLEAPTNRSHLLPKPESLTVSWGEKIFSPKELLQYSVLPLSPTPLELQYYEKILEICRKGGWEERMIAAGRTRGAKKSLFTYTSRDRYTHRHSILTSGPPEVPLSPSRLHRAHGVHYTAAKVKSRDDIVIESTKFGNTLNMNFEEEQLKDAEEWHLMAYLHEEEGEELQVPPEYQPEYPELDARFEGFEVHLCTIRVSSGGVITCTPSLRAMPHRIALPPAHYTYSVSVASPQGSPSLLDAEYNLFTHLHAEMAKERRTIIGETFEAPPSPVGTRYQVLGELLSVRGVTDGVWCEWWGDLPEQGWLRTEQVQSVSGQIPNSDAPFYGRSQVSHPRYNGTEYEAHVGLPLEWSSVALHSVGNHSRMPRLYFMLRTLSTFDRHRVAGYGWCDVPSKPGCYTLMVPTARPVSSITSTIRRFFIGGGDEYESPTDVAPRWSKDMRRVNFFGHQSQSGPTIVVRLNVVIQAEYLKVVKNVEKTAGIDDIRDALIRARARVKLLREEREREARIKDKGKEKLVRA